MKHWSEGTEAPRVRGTFRNLPPNTWEVTVWRDEGRGDAVTGVIDDADVHRLIAAVMMADVGVPEPEPSVVSRETSGSGYAV